MTKELLSALRSAGWLRDNLESQGPAELAVRALEGDGANPGIFKGRRVASLLEFGRIMHAEMAALTTAARRGSAIKGATLYTTTYPCHECMRLIIGAGIVRVVYIDPYPKSLVTEMFISHIGTSSVEMERVDLVPFLGVAPRLVSRFFDQASGRERDVKGTFERWDGKQAAFAGEESRYLDVVRLREGGIATMLAETYLPRVDASAD